MGKTQRQIIAYIITKGVVYIKIVLAGGGTAGHVTPNIALIDILKEVGFSEIHYIGTNGIEKELAQKAGLTFHEIPAGKLRRYIDMQNIKDIGRIFKGTSMAKKILKDLKPGVVFSKGGFASCPVVWAAKQLKIPVVLHESDNTPGLANKLCLPFADRICYAFPETSQHLPKDKSIYTGIPIRSEILKGNREKGLKFCGFDGTKPVLTLIGGSQGSKFLNETLIFSLNKLTKTFDVCHICGKGNINHELMNVKGYAQFEYIHEELCDVMQATDIFVSRAGATTIFEFLALQKPAVLIPLCRGSRGDQILNANSFEKQGLAKKLEESEVNEKTFLDAINYVYENRKKFAENAKKSNVSESASKIAEVILNTIKK